jgi:hypothetical protein
MLFCCSVHINIFEESEWICARKQEVTKMLYTSAAGRINYVICIGVGEVNDKFDANFICDTPETNHTKARRARCNNI